MNEKAAGKTACLYDKNFKWRREPDTSPSDEPEGGRNQKNEPNRQKRAAMFLRKFLPDIKKNQT